VAASALSLALIHPSAWKHYPTSVLCRVLERSQQAATTLGKIGGSAGL
jgi:hypothetical protein